MFPHIKENPCCASAAEIDLTWRAAEQHHLSATITAPPPPRPPASAEGELCCGNNNGGPECLSPFSLSRFNESRVVRSVLECLTSVFFSPSCDLSHVTVLLLNSSYRLWGPTEAQAHGQSNFHSSFTAEGINPSKKKENRHKIVGSNVEDFGGFDQLSLRQVMSSSASVSSL